jgi:hypothetical protein
MRASSILRAVVDKDWAALRKLEWSMGNGQCPECHAQGPSWLGFGGWGSHVGHTKKCPVAKTLVDAGLAVVFKTRYDRLPRESDEPRSEFGAVDYDSPRTIELMESIAKAHPEMIAYNCRAQ